MHHTDSWLFEFKKENSMKKMTIFLLLLISNTLFGTCIPIKEVSILKKAIVTMDLGRKQREKLGILESRLKEKIFILQKEAKQGKDGTLSSLFIPGKFKRKNFLDMTTMYNHKVGLVLADYFEDLYNLLSNEQQKILVEKFKKIERRKKRSATKK